MLQESVLEEVGRMNWGTFKPRLAEAIIAHLAPIQTNYARVVEDQTMLDKVRDLYRYGWSSFYCRSGQQTHARVGAAVRC